MSAGHSAVMSDAVRKAYRRGEEDETLRPRVLVNGSGPVGRIRKGDAVIFYNIRGEREIELTRSLVDETFDAFAVERGMGLHFTTMIEYQKGLPVEVAFPPEGVVEDTLGEVLSRHGLRQARITEAEKAVHVLYFLNGKKEEPVLGEERIIVPTRKDVVLFDEAPEMSIGAITEAAVGKIRDPACDVVFLNFPNVDVVGHIENERAVLAAVEAVDNHAGRVIEEAERAGMDIVVTADHGTVEKWLYPDGSVDTGHTDSPVPFILISAEGGVSIRGEGELADVAPTVLDLLDLPRPAVMTGRSLIEKKSGRTGSRRRLLFIILDGWGLGDRSAGNLIAKARTPVMDRLWKEFPRASLKAAGEAVGLPEGTVGNSEVGHLHIGAGRRVYSDRARIDRAIADGTFFGNRAFLAAMQAVRERGRSLHLMGIVSFFSSHGSVEHLFALMELAAREGLKEVHVHAMLGRRGEQRESGARYIEMIEKKARETGGGRVVSVIGRYWSMDREENWDRIEKTYRMLVCGEGEPVEERRT